MATRQQTVEDVRRIVGKAATERGVAPIAEYLALALRDLDRYSQRKVRHVITGDGTDEYELPSSFSQGFSVVERVRWVAAADFNAPAVYLDKELYDVEFARDQHSAEAVGTGDGSTRTFDLDETFALQAGATVTVNAVTQAVTAYAIGGDETGSKLTFAVAPTTAHAIVATYWSMPPQIRFLSVVPSASDRVLVEFTARHVLDDSAASCTLNDDQAGALAQRAAAYLLRSAAASVATTVPQNTDTDFASSAMTSAADAYRRLADDADAAFYVALGIGAPDPETGLSAGKPVFTSVPATPNAANRRYLTHPRRGASWLG